MDIAYKLNKELLAQPFADGSKHTRLLKESRQTARCYARTENALAVLSDMQTNQSYIYHSGLSDKLALGARGETQIVHSIWEEEIFVRIHPDDLSKKHSEELRFFHFLKNIPEEKRTDYYLATPIRMCDPAGTYYPILHRLFYIASQSNGSIRLALCLYNLATDTFPKHAIVDSAQGRTFEPETHDCRNLLSTREKEVLQLIARGMASKEIAAALSISVNTVNRHRQNILEKLRVQNSIEACRIAGALHLLE